MLKASDYKIGDAIYTFVADNGENFNIDSERLRQWCLSNKPEIFLVPLRRSLAREMVRNRTVSTERVKQLGLHYVATRKIPEPIIFCKTNSRPDVILVDGHHRYVLAVVAKMPLIEAFALERHQWEPFRIHGLPAIDQDQLKDLPLKPRDYLP